MHFLQSFVALCAASSVVGLNIGRRAATTTTVTSSTTSSSASSSSSAQSSPASTSTSSVASSSIVSSITSSSTVSSITSTSTAASSSSVTESSPTSTLPTETEMEEPPMPTAWQLHPNGNLEKCLDVRDDKRANGTKVQIYDCNGTGAQDWVLDFANTTINLANTGFCLDAGDNLTNGGGLQIWSCIEERPAQQFYYTEDLRIAVTDQEGQCIDLTDGILDNGSAMQTWKCTDNNTNQVWTGLELI